MEYASLLSVKIRTASTENLAWIPTNLQNYMVIGYISNVSNIPGETTGNTNLEKCGKCGKEYMRDFPVRTAADVHNPSPKLMIVS